MKRAPAGRAKRWNEWGENDEHAAMGQGAPEVGRAGTSPRHNDRCVGKMRRYRLCFDAPTLQRLSVASIMASCIDVGDCEAHSWNRVGLRFHRGRQTVVVTHISS